jgi:hypothetical protein
MNEIVQKTFSYNQMNTGNIKEVFPLLCPVRERDWIDGWDCKMIYSISGLIEKNCVFITQLNKDKETIWHVTQYDKKNYRIEFLRVTPKENTVRINMQLEKINESYTKTYISYLYTLLENTQVEEKMSQIEQSFLNSMTHWEKAINYYLKTGKKLKRVKA